MASFLIRCKMASDEYDIVQDVCHHGGDCQHEVVYDEDEIQAEEIVVEEDLPSTVIRDDVDVSSLDDPHQQLVVFHELPEDYGGGGDDVVLQPAEEVIDDGCGHFIDYSDDINGGLGSCITVSEQSEIGVLEVLPEYPATDVVSSVNVTSANGTVAKRVGGGRGRGKRTVNGGTRTTAKSSHLSQAAGDALNFLEPSGSQQWHKKQVQVKTLDGEFSVTMWASGEIYCCMSLMPFSMILCL
jgi:transcription factor YY